MVSFHPPLPDDYIKAINKLGVGNMNRLYVSFTNRFWGNRKGWLNFVTKSTETNRYPVALIVNSIEKNILCFFLAGEGSREVHKLNNDEIAKDVTH